MYAPIFSLEILQNKQLSLISGTFHTLGTSHLRYRNWVPYNPQQLYANQTMGDLYDSFRIGDGHGREYALHCYTGCHGEVRRY